MNTNINDGHSNHKKVLLPSAHSNVNTTMPNLRVNTSGISPAPAAHNLDILKQQRNDFNKNKSISEGKKAPIAPLDLHKLRANLNKNSVVTELTTVDDEPSHIVMETKKREDSSSREKNPNANLADTAQAEITKTTTSKSVAGSLPGKNSNNILTHKFERSQLISPANFYNQWTTQSRESAEERAKLLVQVQMQRMQMARKRLSNTNNPISQKRQKQDTAPQNLKNLSSNPSPDSYRFADPVEDVETTGVYDHAQKFKSTIPAATIARTTMPPHVLQTKSNNLAPVLNPNPQLNNPVRKVLNNPVAPAGVNLVGTTKRNILNKSNPNNNTNSAMGKGANNAIEVKDDDDDDDEDNENYDHNNIENQISVKLPLVGPFVNGFLSGMKPVIEFFEGSPESIIHEATSKILFAISQHGGTIESQKDRVTFPLSETEAVASDFISEQRSKITDAIRLSFVETKNNHELIISEAGKKMKKCLELELAKKDGMILQMKENLDALVRDHENQIDKVTRKYKRQLKEIKLLQEKALNIKDKQLEDERKNHRRGLAAYLNATQRTFQQMVDDDSLDSN